MATLSKPILCLDFDGVCHSYVSGWRGADVIPDPPVAGLLEFIAEARRHFDIRIFSTRSHQKGGEAAMVRWFEEQHELWSAKVGRHILGGIGSVISFPKQKPPAMVSLDDRCLLFEGEWPSMERLVNFKPWNKKG